MSHELRTPLSSLLILSDQLSKNNEGNLSGKQMEYAKTIHSSGTDLLGLINDILDLSKIESGTVSVEVGELRIPDLHDYVERTFRHVADSKGLRFDIAIERNVPPIVYTDAKRLQQVIKNLLANAFKFTEQGTVTLRIEHAAGGWTSDHEALRRTKEVLAFSVVDTGIGISPDKQQIIFEAFQQADGSTSRKYGGTGLGLAISREIARLLGGELRVSSTPGAGSTFTLYMPQTYVPPKPVRKPAKATADVVTVPAVAEAPLELAGDAALLLNELGDDRDRIQGGDRVLLLVDNDENFARFLLDLAHEHGFRALVATTGAGAVALARDYEPDAITLDLRLPDVDGWKVLSRLKNDLAVRHIPVYVISADEDCQRTLRLGARSVLAKPIKNADLLAEAFRGIRRDLDERRRALLLVAPETERFALRQVLAIDGVEIVEASDADGAIGAAASRPFEGIVVGADHDPAAGLTIAEQIGARLPDSTILLSMPRPPAKRDESALRQLVATGRVQHVQSAERLLDAVLLRLDWPLAEIPAADAAAVSALYDNDQVLSGRRVLIVDDDIRNIFALTSVLEREQMIVLAAETGKAAIDLLQRTPDVDIVLMDIMMPGMDGYDTMGAIRKMKAFRHLPIIAVTAKAMKGDREKTIEAGAWDYLSKPVDSNQMLAVMRAWLRR